VHVMLFLQANDRNRLRLVLLDLCGDGEH
jgi:hypothetical protein